jgi:outer membrane protein
VRAGREHLRTVEQAVLLEGVTAYVDVVRHQAIFRLHESNVSALTRELKATQDRFTFGRVTRTDVAQAQARRARAVSALDLAKANLTTSRAVYEQVIGNPPSSLEEPPVPVHLLPKSIEDAIAIAARENPALVSVVFREQAARHSIDRIWGELLPDVRVEANYARRFDPSPIFGESEVTQVTGRLTVPIFQGGEVYARLRQAKHTHVSRLQEVEQARTELKSAVVAAWSRVQASQARLESDLAQVEANRTALAGVREEQKAGRRTLLEVLNAEEELLDSEIALATTKRDRVVNSYNLLSSIGRLNAQELGLGMLGYNAEAYYQEMRRKWWGLSITHADGRRHVLDLWATHGQYTPVK